MSGVSEIEYSQATGQSWADFGPISEPIYWRDIRQVTPFIRMSIIGQGIIGLYQACKDSIFSLSSGKRYCNKDIFEQNFINVFLKSTDDVSSRKTKIGQNLPSWPNEQLN